jgi:hypothetical protein
MELNAKDGAVALATVAVSLMLHPCKWRMVAHAYNYCTYKLTAAVESVKAPLRPGGAR